MLKQRVQRKMCGYKAETITGDRRTLHNDELHDLYSLPNIIRVIKWMR